MTNQSLTIEELLYRNIENGGERAYLIKKIKEITDRENQELRNEIGQLRANEKKFNGRYTAACNKKEKFQRWYESAQKARKILESKGDIQAAIKLLPIPEHTQDNQYGDH